MQEFLALAERMRTSTDRNFFENIYGFFLKINKLGRDEVIAAYQAFRILRSEVLTAAERDRHEKLLKEIERSLIYRMRIICSEISSRERLEVAEVFRLVTDSFLLSEIVKRARAENAPR